jgi:hypothetical protein
MVERGGKTGRRMKTGSKTRKRTRTRAGTNLSDGLVAVVVVGVEVSSSELGGMAGVKVP